MRDNDLEERAAELQLPDDVERRYKELQDEIRKLELSPATRQGESREERYARRQRLQARRREFEQMVRRPLALRALSNPLTVGAMLGAIVLLCAISFLGGVALTGVFNKPALATDTAAQFWSAMENGDFGIAHQYLDPHQDLQQFTQQANDAQLTLGPIVNIQLIAQTGGQAKDNSASLTYTVMRAGTANVKSFSMPVTLRFENLQSNGGWLIVDFGNLFPSSPPAPTTATPTH